MNTNYQFKPREYVSSYKTSGLSRRAFARIANVPESTLREWEKRAHVRNARPMAKATVKTAKATAKTTKEVNTYNTVMTELESALGSIRTIKRILSTL